LRVCFIGLRRLSCTRLLASSPVFDLQRHKTGETHTPRLYLPGGCPKLEECITMAQPQQGSNTQSTAMASTASVCMQRVLLASIPLLEGDEARRVRGADTGAAVRHRLVRDGELTEVVADHLRLIITKHTQPSAVTPHRPLPRLKHTSYRNICKLPGSPRTQNVDQRDGSRVYTSKDQSTPLFGL